MRPIDRRTLLSVEHDPVPIPGFLETITAARVEARAIAKETTAFHGAEAIANWHAECVKNIRAQAGHSSGLTHSILGIALDEVGRTVLESKDPWRHVVGLNLSVDAQQHLTRALLALATEDRRTLCQTDSMGSSNAIVGAIAVARLVAALETVGVKSYLPSIEEDRSLGIDLLVRRKRRNGHSACLQIKAVGTMSRAYRETNPEERLVCGVNELNRFWQSTWIPIRAEVCVRHVPRACLIEKHSRTTAQDIRSLLASREGRP